MGLAIYPSKLKEQISSMDSILEDNKNFLNIIINEIKDFIENPKLEGIAWTNVKHQMENHISLIHGIIQGSDEIINSSKTLIYMVGEEDLVEDEILDSIDQLNFCILNWQNTLDVYYRLLNNEIARTPESAPNYYMYMTRKYATLINDTYNIIALLESKLETLSWIAEQTAELYNGAEKLFTFVQDGLNSISDFDVNAPTSVLNSNNSWKNNLYSWQNTYSQTNQADIEEGSITRNWLNNNTQKNIYKFGMITANYITNEELIRLISSIAAENYLAYGITYSSNDNYLNNLRLERTGFKDKKIIEDKILIEDKYTGYKYIDRQNVDPFKNMRLGVATLNNTGCECIATYNAMVSLGRRQDLSSIIRYYDADSLMARGVLGTNPYKIPTYFSKMGYDVYVTDDVDTFDNEYLKDSDTVIISYLTGSGEMGISMVHTVCAVREEEGYRVYNDSDLKETYKKVSYIEEGLENPQRNIDGTITTVEVDIEIVEIIGVKNK